MKSQKTCFFGTPYLHLCVLPWNSMTHGSKILQFCRPILCMCVCVKRALFDYYCLLSSSTAVLALIKQRSEAFPVDNCPLPRRNSYVWVKSSGARKLSHNEPICLYYHSIYSYSIFLLSMSEDCLRFSSFRHVPDVKSRGLNVTFMYVPGGKLLNVT